MENADVESVADLIKEVSEMPLVIGEGIKTFEPQGVKPVLTIMGKHKSFESFIENASFKEKMEVSGYVNTGKYVCLPADYLSSVDRSLRITSDAVLLLKDYIGIDTRGVITILPVIGKTLDIFALESKVDGRLTNWLDPNSSGHKFKSGRVFQGLVDVMYG